MKVLLVSQAYPPFAIVGALRARKVAQMFQSRGHDVTVVTERLAKETGDVRPNDDGITVRTVDGGLPYRLRVVALRNRLRGRQVELSSWDGPRSSASPRNGDDSGASQRTIFGPLKRLAISVLRLPDDQQHLVRPSVRMARRVMGSDTDIVYTTAPSFSTHLVGLLLSRRPGLRWIAEFRDPWTTARQPTEGGDELSPLLQRANGWLEQQCLQRADVVVAVTESVGHQLAEKLPAEHRHKVVVAMNGIDQLDSPRVRVSCLETSPYRIVYTGSFYHDRDPRAFLEAVAAWMNDCGLGAANVRVDFAGRCRSYADVSVEELVARLGLSEVVEFHDWLPHDEIQCMLREADLVLMIARSQPAQVPNKLFEYLGARTPVLAVVDTDGESARILNAVGGQYVIAAPEGSVVTAEMVREALGQAYERRNEPVIVNEDALEGLLTEHQFARLAAAIGA